ncbi:MAG: single-stranded DNA-binding protein [Erysipelotrichaceae bacterium]|nr:single-stranded DNA-binding protein [Erysipelotrichaceae bacterium]
MNTVCLIGKVKNKPEIIETSKGSKVAKILLDVNRNFPNSNGVIESEVYQVQLWRGIADQFKDCINPGMTVGIKGRLTANNWETSAGNKIYSAEIIAEHISFIHTTPSAQKEAV